MQVFERPAFHVDPATVHRREAKSVSRIFALINPVAGNCDVDAVRHELAQHFGVAGKAYVVYERNGWERIADIVRVGLGRDYDAFVAAGGNGTVSGIVDGLVYNRGPAGHPAGGHGECPSNRSGYPAEHRRCVASANTPARCR